MPDIKVPIPPVRGISRLADNPRAVVLSLDRPPTDDEMRAIHNLLREHRSLEN